MFDEKEIKASVARAFEKYGPVWVETIQKELIKENKIASVQLYDSIQFKINTKDHQVSLQVLALDYFKYVDEGRRSGKQPPIEAILNWIEIKPVKPRQENNPGNKQSLPILNKSLAFLIARSIGTHGIAPTFIMRDSVDGTIGTFYADLKEELTKTLGDGTVELLNKLKESLTVKIHL